MLKKLVFSLIALASVVVVGIVHAATVDARVLSGRTPFHIVEHLTEFSYEELARMYPALSDTDLRSLRWRIVNHMQGQE